ncbi:MAG: hypothetical protein QM758_07320 [Armatimonas sp.]
MRRTFFKEEEATARLTPAPQGASGSSIEQLPAQEAPQKATKKPAIRHREKSSPLKARLLKGGIITFASLGIASLVLPPLLGVPLDTLAQSVNLKAAYSGTNMTQVRVNAAMKLGNLGAATDALLTLTPGTTEATELTIALFPRLLDAQEYDRAAQVLRYLQLYTNTPPGAVAALAENTSAISPYELGKRMEAGLGLEKALVQIGKEPNLSALRSELLPPLFSAAATKELPVLEKVAPTLQGEEQYHAVLAIVGPYIQAKDWNTAWRWASSLSAPFLARGEGHVLEQLARLDGKEALRRLLELQNATEFPGILDASLKTLRQYHAPEAKLLAEQLKPSVLRDQVIRLLLIEYSFGIKPYSPQEIISLLDLQTDPAVKAWTLSQSGSIENNLEKGAQTEFVRNVLTPRFTALAQQYPRLMPLHDEFLTYYSSKKLPKPSLIEKLRSENFQFANPTDADKLTGLRG